MLTLMFKSPKEGIKKTTVPEAKPRDPSLLQVLRAEALLAVEKRRVLLKELRQLVDHLPDDVYNAQYLKALHNFAEFVQELPETNTSYYSFIGGLLDHGLERARVALSLVRSYFSPKAGETFTPIENLWMYAVFTAALLLDIGKLALRQEVLLCQKDGTVIKPWHPYTASMVGQGEYYKYQFLKETYEYMRQRVTFILARQLLTQGFVPLSEKSPTGFNWIASDKNVLEAWFAMLNQEQTGGGRVLTFIPLAEEQTILSFFAEEKLEALTVSQLIDHGGPFAAAKKQKSSEGFKVLKKGDPGKAFYKWLKSGLETQKIHFNKKDSSVHILPQGKVFISNKAFEKFAKENPKYGDWQKKETLEFIKTKFTDLDITAGGLSAERLNLNILDKGGALRGKIVISKFIVFDPRKFPPGSLPVSKFAPEILSNVMVHEPEAPHAAPVEAPHAGNVKPGTASH